MAHPTGFPGTRIRTGVIACLLASTLLAGCSGGGSGSRGPQRYAGPEFDATVPATSPSAAPTGQSLMDSQFLAAYRAAAQPNSTPQQLRQYVTLGTALSASACTAWLDTLSARNQTLDYARLQGGILTVLATGILGLAGADADVFTGVALGAAAINGSMDLYRDYRLLGEESSAITDMVLGKMDAANTFIATLPLTTFPEAYNALYSFSRLCEPAVVHQSVLDAIRTARPVADTYSQGAASVSSTSLRRKIGALYGSDIVSEGQLLGLYWQHVIGLETDADRSKAAALQTGLQTGQTTLSASQKAEMVALLEALPLPVQTALRQQVATARSTGKTADNTGAETDGTAALMGKAVPAPAPAPAAVPAAPAALTPAPSGNGLFRVRIQ